MAGNTFWILSLTLLVVFGFFAMVNAYHYGQLLYKSYKKKGPSLAPFIGGISGCIGILIMPVGSLSERLTICWIPLFTDVGCMPYLVNMILTILHQKQ